jgi:hypothetical protein
VRKRPGREYKPRNLAVTGKRRGAAVDAIHRIANAQTTEQKQAQLKDSWQHKV